jgi:tRNA pseudouridine38-40 synthase
LVVTGSNRRQLVVQDHDRQRISRHNGAVPRRSRPPIAPPAAGLARFAATVAYDGAAFHGYAASPGVVTIAGAMDAALSRITSVDIHSSCAGRTDAGVHGWGQVASFDAPQDLDPGRVQHSLNRMLGPAISIRALQRVADDFDARFSATARTYRYRVLNKTVPDPFLHATSWHVRTQLDIDRMNEAGAHLLGEHDFASFCRKRLIHVRGEEVEAHLTRKILEIRWSRADDLLDLWISATAFCHQMVRAITGTLVEVGLGKREPASVADILAARDRSTAGALAPPKGLTLWAVAYD